MKHRKLWHGKKITWLNSLVLLSILVVLILHSCNSSPQKLMLRFTLNEIKEIRIVELNTKKEVIVDDEFDQLAGILIDLSELEGDEVGEITEPYYLLRVKHEVGEELIYLSGIRELIFSKKKYRTEPYHDLFDLVDTIYKAKAKPEPVFVDPANFQNIYRSTYLTIPDDYDWEALRISGMTSFSEGSYCNYTQIFVSEFHEMLEYCRLTVEVIDKDIKTFGSIVDKISGTKKILTQLKEKIMTHVSHQKIGNQHQLFEFSLN